MPNYTDIDNVFFEINYFKIDACFFHVKLEGVDIKSLGMIVVLVQTNNLIALVKIGIERNGNSRFSSSRATINKNIFKNCFCGYGTYAARPYICP